MTCPGKPGRRWLARAWTAWVLLLLSVHAGPGSAEVSFVLQLGHANVLTTAVVVAPDGITAVSASWDGTLKVWDLTFGRELRTLRGHSGRVNALVLTGDGKAAVSGGADGTLRMWDLESGRQIRAVQAHDEAVLALALTADGSVLASSGADGRIRLWDAGLHSAPRLFAGPGPAIGAIAFSPSGGAIAGAGDDGSIRAWDLDTGDQRWAYPGGSGRANALAFSPDGERLVSGHIDGRLREWHVADGRAGRAFAAHRESIWAIAFSRDGRVIASASADHTARLHDARTNVAFAVLEGHRSWVRALDFTADGTRLVTAGADQTIRVWDVASHRALRVVTGHGDAVHAVAFSPDSRLAATAGADRTIRIWDLVDGAAVQALRGHRRAVLAVAYSPDGGMVASGGDDNLVKLWNARTGAETRTLFGHEWAVNALAFAPDGRRLFTASGDRTIRIWSLPDGRQLHVLKAHQDRVLAIAASPDGARILSGSADGTVRLWDAGSGREVGRMAAGRGAVRAVAFSTDGSLVAAGHDDGSITTWSAATGALQAVHAGHAGNALAVAFSTRNGAVVSGGGDGTLRSIDAVSGEARTFPSIHGGRVHAIAASPDGRWLASASADSTIRLWNAADDRPVVTLAPQSGAQWVIVSEQGFFESSSDEAERALLVRFGPALRDVTDIAAYRERKYRPDIVQRLLRGQAVGDLESLATIRPAPSVALSVPAASNKTPRLTARLRLVDRGGGFGNWRIFVNGTAVASGDAAALAGTGGAREGTLEVALVPGRNEVSAVAFNADNSVGSDPSFAVVSGDFTPERRPRLHALVVGIDQFADSRLDLKYAAADAAALSRAIQSSSRGLFSSVEVELLTGAAATSRDTIVAALRRYRNIDAADAFLLYVASHGTVVGQDLGRQSFFLLTSNVRDGSEAGLRRDALSQEQIQALVSSIPASQKLLIIDACHSGALGDAFARDASFGAVSTGAAVRVLSGALGSAVVAAATSRQQALEGYEGHGLFTWVLLQALSGKADRGGRGTVTTRDLSDFVQAEVPRLAARIFKRQQTPQAHHHGRAFPVASVQPRP